MREKKPEQLSIFDFFESVEKPESFYRPDSFATDKKEMQNAEAFGFEKVKYKGEAEIADQLYTVYVRRLFDEKSGRERFILSVSDIDFSFGYNSLERLLTDWELDLEELKKRFAGSETTK